MKSKMLIMLIVICFVIPSAALASSKILNLKDIGAGEVTFAFIKNFNGGVALTARISQECWDQDCEPYRYYSTGTLQDFSLEDRQVYFTGSGASVHCGEIQGVFQRSQIIPACQVSASAPVGPMFSRELGMDGAVQLTTSQLDTSITVPAVVCSAGYSEDDCTKASTTYRVYITIQKDPSAGEGTKTTGLFEDTQPES